MSKFRKPFLSIMKPIWAERIPDWKPLLFSPSFWTSSDATFSWANFAPNSVLRYHAFINFSSKRAGEFTCDIFITDSTNRLDSKGIHRLPEDISSLRLGGYRVGWFISGKDIWWHLEDEVAKHQDFLRCIGQPPQTSHKRDHKDWYASSYDMPQKEIMREAAEDLADRFRAHVIPRLLRS